VKAHASRATAPRIVAADAHLLVVDKPAGLLSVPDRSGKGATLRDALRAARLVPADEPFRVVHRLDRDASGVIVFARSELAQRDLTRQFAEHRVEKIYVALVSGFVEREGRIDLPLRYDDRQGRAVVDPRRGKRAATIYRILQRLMGNTLLECRPISGRTHQIRAHLAAIGHPLTVDLLYGGARAVLLSSYKSGYRASSRREEQPLIARLTLHAGRIAFEHPARTGPVTYEAPLPKDLRATLTQLARV
jgi:23S rRNA pseudouridine1911/1915/1917 synthase